MFAINKDDLEIHETTFTVMLHVISKIAISPLRFERGEEEVSGRASPPCLVRT